MNLLLKCCLQVLGLLLALSVVSGAQDSPSGKRKQWAPGGQAQERQGERPGERRGPPPDRDGRPGPGFQPPPFEMFSDSKVVKGAPYSATAITETIQTLADGTKITHKKTDTIFRDSEGRTRREQTLDRLGPFVLEGKPQQLIFINDVVAGMRIFLDPNRRTARKRPSHEGPPSRPAPPPPAGGERKSESLGKQTIEGIEAEGTRTTITIPTGRIGNDRPIEIVSERWESPALQVVVLSKIKDPFTGETTYRLTNIERSEPSRALFEIPSDYVLEEDKRGRPPGGDRRKPPHD